MNDPHPFLDVAQDAAEKAAAFIRQEAHKTLDIGYKGATDLVTHVDLGSEKIIKETVQSKFPEHQFLLKKGA